MVRREKRRLYFIRQQRYIETVMLHATSNVGMQPSRVRSLVIQSNIQSVFNDKRLFICDTK